MKPIPISRFAEPVEVSRLAAFLAPAESSCPAGGEFVAGGALLCGPGY